MTEDRYEYCGRCHGKGAIRHDPESERELPCSAYEEGAFLCTQCGGMGWVLQTRQARTSSQPDPTELPEWMEKT